MSRWERLRVRLGLPEPAWRECERVGHAWYPIVEYFGIRCGRCGEWYEEEQP